MDEGPDSGAFSCHGINEINLSMVPTATATDESKCLKQGVGVFNGCWAKMVAGPGWFEMLFFTRG